MQGIQSPLSMGFWSEAYIRCADVIIIKGTHAMNIYMENNDMFFWIRCCVDTTQKVDGSSNQRSVVDGWLMLMIANKEGKGCAFVFPKRENREKLHGANGTWFYKVTIQLEIDEEINEEPSL